MTKVVIDIPDRKYKTIQEGMYAGILDGEMYKAIKNGTVLPDNPTNGDIVKALFSHCPTYPLFHDIGFYADETRQTMVVAFPTEWWDAPYKGGQDV